MSANVPTFLRTSFWEHLPTPKFFKILVGCWCWCSPFRPNQKMSNKNKKLTVEQKVLLTQKIKEYDQKRIGNRGPSDRALAATLGPKYLGRSISYKLIAKYRKNPVASIQPLGNAKKSCHLLSPEVVEWETRLDNEVSAAFSLANITFKLIVVIALNLIKTFPHPKGRKSFGRAWLRGFMRRFNYSYRRICGNKKKSVVDDNILAKGKFSIKRTFLLIILGETELENICKNYEDWQIVNLDESSLPIKTLGNYSFMKKTKDTIPRSCNDWTNKSRFTILMMISKTGSPVFKPIIIDKALTNGLKVLKTKYESDKCKIRLLQRQHSTKGQHLLHAVSGRGYMSR